MVQVQEDDVLLLSREAIIRHFDSDLNFKQIKSIRTLEEYNDWNNGVTDDDGANMLAQAGNQILVAMPGHQCVGILDLELNRVDTFLNPFRGDITEAEGAVISIAYDSTDSILYVCTRDDYDASGGRISITAYSWPSQQLLWRKSPAYTASSVTTTGNRAFFSTTTWVSLSQNRQFLYVVDRGYGVGSLNVATQVFTPNHYIDAVQPTYFNDSINNSDPPGAFPDVTQLHYYPEMPRTFLALTDGTEGPVSQGVVPTEGNKLNTRVFYRYFNGNIAQDDTGTAQLQLRATSVSTDNNGKIYVLVNQPGSTQNREIDDYPSAPFFWGLMEQQYSPEHFVLVLNSNGTFDRRIPLPIHSAEEADVNHYRSGYLFGHTSTYGNNATHGIGITRNGLYAYTVQIGQVNNFGAQYKGAGPLTKIDLTTGETVYKGDDELVPAWAKAELNDGLFQESTLTPTYRHVLPITFAAPPSFGFSRVIRVNFIG